jgi:hypothetical protein
MRSTLPLLTLFPLALSFAACEVTPPPVARNIAGTQPADIQLRDALKQIVKAHNDRTRLALFVAIPFLHATHPDIRALTDSIGAKNRAFLDDWQSFARAADVDLSFAYDSDLLSQAQKLMEKTQGDALQSAADDFQLLVLNLLYVDYHFGHALIQTTLAQTRDMDPALRTLLERDLAMHNEGLAQISALFKRFKFQ